MKIKYLLVLMVALVILIGAMFVHANVQGSTAAADATKQVKITWHDPNVKTDDFQWQIFVRGEGETFGQPALTVPIAETLHENGEYQSTGSYLVTGTPGGVVKKYFALKAKRGDEMSDFSEEAFAEFSIPMAAPYGVLITITVTPE